MKGIGLACLVHLVCSTALVACGEKTNSSETGLSANCELEIRLPEKGDGARSNVFYSGAGARNSKLIAFGVRHSNSPDEKQFEAVEHVFLLQKPTIAFYEGNRSTIFGDLSDSVLRAGEPGYLRSLAAREGVAYLSWEIPIERLHSMLSDEFGGEKAQLYSLLRVVNAVQRRGNADRVESAVLRRIRQHQEASTEFPINSFQEFAAAYSRHFPEAPLFHVKDNWFDPRMSSDEVGSQFINDVARYASNARNDHLIREVEKALLKGERVFVLAGEGHIPPNERAFTCLSDHFEKHRSLQ